MIVPHPAQRGLCLAVLAFGGLAAPGLAAAQNAARETAAACKNGPTGAPPRQATVSWKDAKLGEITEDRRQTYGLPPKSGAQLYGWDRPDGLSISSILLTVDGQPIDAGHSLPDLIKRKPAGSSFVLCGVSPSLGPRATQEWTVEAKFDGFDGATYEEKVDCSAVKAGFYKRLEDYLVPENMYEARLLYAQMKTCNGKGLPQADIDSATTALQTAARRATARSLQPPP